MTSNLNKSTGALRLLIADYVRVSVLGSGVSILPAEAAALLSAGASSPALNYLAGLSRDSDEAAIRRAVDQAALELGLPTIDSPTWRSEFAELAVVLFLGGAISADETAQIVQAVLWGAEPVTTEGRFDELVGLALVLDEYPEQRRTLLAQMRESARAILSARPDLIARFATE